MACVKQAYESERTAKRRAHVESKRTGDVIRAYLCGRCRAWHIGHVSTRGKVGVR